MIGRWLQRLLRAQSGWARPLGDFNVRWLQAIFWRIRPIADLLNGKWLGHSVHAMLSDVPVGVMTFVVVLDLVGQRTAADLALGFGILAMLGAAVSGSADYTDTDDEARISATVHATLMIGALLIYLVSLGLRLGAAGDADRTLPIALSMVAYVILALAAWVGGEIVYFMGNMVNRHAWRFGSKSSWLKLEVGELPDGQPVAARAGSQSLVAVRQGERVFALHAQCAHAGGPLVSGRVVDGCIECPWHASRFELATGRRKQGPSTFDQPSYEVRTAADGGYEVRRVVAGRPSSATAGS